MATAVAIEPEVVKPPADDDYEHYEEIDGVRVELPPMSVLASRIASRLHIAMGIFATTNDLGEVVSETLFHLPLKQPQNRRPDLAFVSRRRWPSDEPMRYRDSAWNVIPELVVEVVSPTDRAEELMEKLTQYFQAGVQLAWVIYPKTRLVQLYTSMQDVRPFRDADIIDAQGMLPGFSIRAVDLFPREDIVPDDTVDDE